MTTMPNGPADNSPTCHTCGLYLRVHGCSAEWCANPETRKLCRGCGEMRVLDRAWLLCEPCAAPRRAEMLEGKTGIPQLDAILDVVGVTITLPTRRPDAIVVHRDHADGPQTVTVHPIAGACECGHPSGRHEDTVGGCFDCDCPARRANLGAPPGYVSIASTGADVQAARVCECDRCEADGQHAPMCAVHWEPPKACDCGLAGRAS